MSEPIIILLVEDEALVAHVMEDVLEGGGFTVHHAATASDAMAEIDRIPDALAGLVTDIRLGAGRDGWDVAKYARERIPTLPVLYMSADSAAEHASRGVPDSMMLAKPFADAQLITALATLLNARPALDASAAPTD